MDGLTVLFTGVGRRVELVRAFREAAFRLGVPLRVLGADSSPTAPALAFCDGRVPTRGMREAGYAGSLLDACGAEGVDLVVPTIDTDLMALAEARPLFEARGTKVLVADPGKVALCRDKRLTGELFSEAGLDFPEAVDDWEGYAGPFPCFIKPLDGSSSVGAARASSREELSALAGGLPGGYVVQPFVDGDEYTVDVFCDYAGRLVSAVPRRRDRVRAGEVIKTTVDMDARIVAEATRLVGVFRPRGPMTAQLIRERASGRDVFIEVNPRFGGGSPLSMAAGADSAEACLRMLLGEDVAASAPPVADGASYSRFDWRVCTSHGEGLPLGGVVLDLDDTLFLEGDYVASGLRAAASLCPDPACALAAAEEALASGGRPVDAMAASAGGSPPRDELLRAYRYHSPELSLLPGAREALGALRAAGLRLGVVTDGRPEGQRAKIEALGLGPLVDDIVVTDELGGLQFRKPCDIAFRILQRRWGIPFGRMAYVGDNPAKDFRAPAELGMRSLRLRHPGGLHAGEPQAGVEEARDWVEASRVLLGWGAPRG